jgi:hypothetical protein
MIIYIMIIIIIIIIKDPGPACDMKTSHSADFGHQDPTNRAARRNTLAA